MAMEHWMSLFNENLEKIWLEEREEIRSLAMLSYCFSLEMKKMQSNAQAKIESLKLLLEESDVYENQLKRRSSKLSPRKPGKENTSPNINADVKAPLGQSKVQDDQCYFSPDDINIISKKRERLYESPDIFNTERDTCLPEKYLQQGNYLYKDKFLKQERNFHKDGHLHNNKSLDSKKSLCAEKLAENNLQKDKCDLNTHQQRKIIKSSPKLNNEKKRFPKSTSLKSPSKLMHRLTGTSQFLSKYTPPKIHSPLKTSLDITPKKLNAGHLVLSGTTSPKYTSLPTTPPKLKSLETIVPKLTSPETTPLSSPEIILDLTPESPMSTSALSSDVILSEEISPNLSYRKKLLRKSRGFSPSNKSPKRCKFENIPFSSKTSKGQNYNQNLTKSKFIPKIKQKKRSLMLKKDGKENDSSDNCSPLNFSSGTKSTSHLLSRDDLVLTRNIASNNQLISKLNPTASLVSSANQTFSINVPSNSKLDSDAHLASTGNAAPTHNLSSSCYSDSKSDDICLSKSISHQSDFIDSTPEPAKCSKSSWFEDSKIYKMTKSRKSKNPTIKKYFEVIPTQPKAKKKKQNPFESDVLFMGRLQKDESDSSNNYSAEKDSSKIVDLDSTSFHFKNYLKNNNLKLDLSELNGTEEGNHCLSPINQDLENKDISKQIVNHSISKSTVENIAIANSTVPSISIEDEEITLLSSDEEINESKNKTSMEKSNNLGLSKTSMNIEEIMDYLYSKSDSKEVSINEDNKINASPNITSSKESFNNVKPECKASDKDYVYQEVVRGKARKKLEGWSCAECKRFYEMFESQPDKLKTLMNKCSKHRQQFAPDAETPPGYWDAYMLSYQESETDE